MPLPMPPNSFLVCADPVTGQPTGNAATSQPFPTDSYDSITVAADHLTGLETVGIFVNVQGTNKQVTDIYGTAVNLTATISAVALEGGPAYVFVKSGTAVPCGVYVYGKLA